MTSVEIRSLLQPPNTHESDARVLAYLNSTYKSLDDLEQEADLEGLVEEARQKLESLDTKVRSRRIVLCCRAGLTGTRRSSARTIPIIP